MTRSLECLPWLCLLIGALFAQDEHLIRSIDCGKRGTFKDSFNITWEGDENYITATGEAKIIAGGVGSDRHPSLSTLRCFPTIKKNCYDIPVPVLGGKYLVRVTFYYGNYDGMSKKPTFALHFDGNYWDTVETFIDREVVKEVIYNPQRENITVCVARIFDDQTPFISSIEVRSLESSMYKTVNVVVALMYVARIAFGSSANIRYPDDPYDRIWYSYQPADEEDLTSKASDLTTFTGVMKLPDNPPGKAMNHAVTPASDNATWMTIPNPITSPSPVDVYYNIYYAEVSRTALRGVLRFFHFKIDGVKRHAIILPYGWVQGFCNDTSSLSKSDVFRWENVNVLPETLPPIVNAWEFFTIRRGLVAGTDDDDVNGLKKLKDRFRGQLGSWSGDPCLPIGFNWEWLSCNNDTQPRVIALHLSGYGLNGSLPDFRVILSALENIDLSNNFFTGEIPESLARLSHLRYLNVENNLLNGTPPHWLASYPDLIVKFSGNNLSEEPKTKIGMIVGICVSVVVVALLVVLFFIFYRFCSRKTEPQQKSGPRIFSFSELQEATRDFKREHFIGAGGFGRVYKGILQDGTQVAVKRAYERSGHDLEQFQAEIDTLSKASHDFLVKLIGYCQVKDELFLVYEYMVNGTLASYLYGSDSPNLSWEQRLTICIQAASGLNYLHTGFSKGIIHRDVKTSNILLDEKFTAKVSDFGLSRIGPDLDRSHVTTTVKGTWGYLDPEYFTTQKLTEKSDVYSFGVVLLEVLCARPMNEQLRSWAINCQRNGKLEEIIDPRIVGTINGDSLRNFWETIEQCIEESGVNRPTMAWVFSNLRRALDLQPKPVYHVASMYHEPRLDSFQDARGDSLDEFVGEINQGNQKSGTSTNTAMFEINSVNPEGR